MTAADAFVRCRTCGRARSSCVHSASSISRRSSLPLGQVLGLYGHDGLLPVASYLERAHAALAPTRRGACRRSSGSTRAMPACAPSARRRRVGAAADPRPGTARRHAVVLDPVICRCAASGSSSSATSGTRCCSRSAFSRSCGRRSSDASASRRARAVAYRAVAGALAAVPPDVRVGVREARERRSRVVVLTALAVSLPDAAAALVGELVRQRTAPRRAAACCAVMFAIELVLPFLIVLGRRARLVAFAGSWRCSSASARPATTDSSTC